MKTPLKTALITGGAKRIGEAITRDLAAAGFAVAIHTNSSLAEAEELVTTLRADGVTAAAIQADLRDAVAVQTVMAKASAAIGPIGLLVNNASVFRKDSITDFDNSAWDEHFAVHVKAPSLLARDFAAQRPQGGTGLIVNMIDQRVWAPNPRFYSYMLSKAALWMATRTMAQGLAPHIRVNAIGPGPTLPNERQNQEDFLAQIDGLILKNGPKLDDFGRTIRFLFDTPAITGQMIALDGGQHLAWETPDIREILE